MTVSKTAAQPVRTHPLRLFFALSRTPHGIIDMAAPALAALLCLGHFPPAAVTLVGLITVFAGYTTVYALNDLVDYRSDKRKVASGTLETRSGAADLDSKLLRHPLATGALSLPAALGWTAGWAVVALAGAYWLNPACLVIFLFGCVLEIIYCLLWRVTPLRTLINGTVKTLGPVAAVYAVNPDPPMVFLTVLFLWVFAWEIGGQNIPNDWSDIEEDRRFNAQTIPVALGARRAVLLSITTLAAALFLNVILLWASPLAFGAIFLLCAVAVNIVLLLRPALAMAQSGRREDAMVLFNKASHYPLANLIIVLVRMMF